MSLADPPDTTPAPGARPLQIVWTEPRTAAGIVAYAVLEAVAEAFPKARQRRRFAAALADAGRRLDSRAYFSDYEDRDTPAASRRKAEAAATLRAALAARQAVLARLPAAQLGQSAVRPLRAPQTGAEAVLAMSSTEAARKRLTRALNALSGLNERTLALAETIATQLDRIEGDPDIEPGCDDDANIASYVGAGPSRLIDDAEEDRADGEPELGSQEGGPGGTRWNPTAYCWPTDGEVECEDEGCDTDTEAVCEDEGAQCEGGGGDEQY